MFCNRNKTGNDDVAFGLVVPSDGNGNTGRLFWIHQPETRHKNKIRYLSKVNNKTVLIIITQINIDHQLISCDSSVSYSSTVDGTLLNKSDLPNALYIVYFCCEYR